MDKQVSVGDNPSLIFRLGPMITVMTFRSDRSVVFQIADPAQRDRSDLHLYRTTSNKRSFAKRFSSFSGSLHNKQNKSEPTELVNCHQLGVSSSKWFLHFEAQGSDHYSSLDLTLRISFGFFVSFIHMAQISSDPPAFLRSSAIFNTAWSNHQIRNNRSGSITSVIHHHVALRYQIHDIGRISLLRFFALPVLIRSIETPDHLTMGRFRLNHHLKRTYWFSRDHNQKRLFPWSIRVPLDHLISRDDSDRISIIRYSMFSSCFFRSLIGTSLPPARHLQLV